MWFYKYLVVSFLQESKSKGAFKRASLAHQDNI